MRVLIAVLGLAGPASILAVLLIMASLTQKWELVTKTKSYYQWFYIAVGLVGAALLTALIRIGYLEVSGGPPVFCDPHSWFYLVFYYVPLAAAMTLGLGLTWKSWGWLLGESGD